MEITTLAAWGEFIGGIAVVVSLIYLASQIRQNSKLLRTSAASTTAAVSNDISSLLIADSEVARIYWEGMADRVSLSESDRRRFDPLITMHLTGLNQDFQFAKDGVIGEEVWEQRTRGIRRLMRQPVMRSYWNEWRDVFGDAFGDFLDGIIHESEAAG